MIRCPNCQSEVGLRERYERLLDLLEASLIVKRMNDRMEENPESPTVAKALMEASIQMYEQVNKFWNDIPGETLDDKLKAIKERRILERDKDGKFVDPSQVEKEVDIEIVKG